MNKFGMSPQVPQARGVSQIEKQAMPRQPEMFFPVNASSKTEKGIASIAIWGFPGGEDTLRQVHSQLREDLVPFFEEARVIITPKSEPVPIHSVIS